MQAFSFVRNLRIYNCVYAFRSITLLRILFNTYSCSHFNTGILDTHFASCTPEWSVFGLTTAIPVSLVILGGIKAVTFQHLVHCRRADQDFYGPPDSQERLNQEQEVVPVEATPVEQASSSSAQTGLLFPAEYRELSHLPTRPTTSTVSQATPPAPNRPLLQSSTLCAQPVDSRHHAKTNS